MIRIPEYVERRRALLGEMTLPARRRDQRRWPDKVPGRGATPTSAVAGSLRGLRPGHGRPNGPLRARLVQGIADLGPGGAGACRRLAARPPRGHDRCSAPSPTAARARSRRSPRPVAGTGRRPTVQRSARSADPGPLAPIGRWARAVVEMAEASGLVAGRPGRARRDRGHVGRHGRGDQGGDRRRRDLDRARDRRQRDDRWRRRAALRLGASGDRDDAWPTSPDSTRAWRGRHGGRL